MKMKLAVAMSGGVDSSVAAALLKESSHEVSGVTLRLWGEDEDSEPSIASARETCRLLGIPHEVHDFRQEFRRLIIEYFLDEYVCGLTPNPCVRCNERIKFGLLGDAAGHSGAQRLATGHYARIALDPITDRYNLLRAADPRKDQSYFLHRLTQAQLGFALFPLGGMTKDDVRALAFKLGLPAASREESQEVCFIPADDYRGFIERERPDSVSPGEFVDKDGNVLGEHRGVAFYTVGQRKGLGVSSPHGRRYVIERDPRTRRVVLGGGEDLKTPGCTVGNVNWISGGPPDGPVEADIKLRYRFEPVRGTLLPASDGRVEVRFDEPSPGVSPGQSAVFYDGDRIIGGGIINDLEHP